MRLCFSATVTLTLVSLTLPCLAADPPASKRDDSASEKLGMKLSLQCWTFNRLSFFETVDKARELGIKYLEMYPGQKLKPGSNEVPPRPMRAETATEFSQNMAHAGA